MNFLDYAPEVWAALEQKRPVVALESTIITHGMPWPDNLSMAQSVEQIIRDNGAVPATIAVLDGHIKIGLSHLELEHLAKSKKAVKLSRADLAVCLVQKSTGDDCRCNYDRRCPCRNFRLCHRRYRRRASRS